jgi:type II restriction enzyme
VRDFHEWFSHFRDSICDYSYYVDFAKVYRNVDAIKVELNILNSLIGSPDIEEDFGALVNRYPAVLRCIPVLLAVRASEIYAVDVDGAFLYDFAKPNQSAAQYREFMRKTGLFSLMEKHIVHNLVDYVTGVETGLSSNGRKNRGGHLMENLVESNLQKSGFKRDVTYFKEMRISEIEQRWGLDLSSLSNGGKTVKRFDFVVKSQNDTYAIETNFYAGGGSKLNETARSYKNIAQEAKSITGFHFVWFTDGKGWGSARHNLEETFDVLDHLYNIHDLDEGIMGRIFR